jgi:polyhydroxyalkanoate synthase
MMPKPSARTAELVREMAGFNTKVAAALKKLNAITDHQVEIATTPKDEIFRSDKVTLYRYRPLAEQRTGAPVLMVYSLIGRQTMTDLQEDRSLVRNLLGQGVDLWVVDWGNASRADRWLTIDDYVLGYLDDCVAAMRDAAGAEKVNLLGICEGGVFVLAYAALEPTNVQNLILTITPLDFHADERDEKLERGFINVWTRSLSGEDVDKMIELWGVLPGEFMGAVFSMLTPIRSITKYNLDLLDVVDDEAKLLNFLRMEKWLADRPHHPGEAAKQWLKDLYQENRLVNNSWVLAGRTVDLSQVTMPVLNIYAQADHIIPPPTSRALTGKLGTTDYTELGVPGGHIGMFVSSRSQGIVGHGIVDWLAERDQTAAGRAGNRHKRRRAAARQETPGAN